MKKHARLLALLLAVVLTLSMGLVGGCQRSAEGEGGGEARTETIKIGVHTSLTGGLADYGFAAQEGLKLARDKYTGFKVGDTTYEIELVIKDDKGEPAESSVVAQAMVDEKVVGVIGALTSGNTNAALPIYQEAGIPMISGSATLATLTDGSFPNFFRTCIGDSIQGKVLGDWAAEQGFKKVVIVDDKGDYAVGLGDNVEDALKAKSVEVVREHTQEGDTDFSAQVSNIKAAAPDAVIFTGYHREAGLLRKQLVDAGVETAYMGGDGVKSDEIVGEAGGAANVEGMLATIGGIAQEDMADWEQFKADYTEATGKEPGPYAETNYDALGALVAAITKAGSTDGDAVIEALREIEHTGITGTFGFDENGEFVAKGASARLVTITKWKLADGKWVAAE
ncbi:MAG: branched-chain amino acid ABC transporter substrate-binding protein [Coriobacteriia bacterium]|nr:branched-chain amino acid ABC transporter substrate-binding protein [Coriobacteriia bacterium]